MTTHLYLIRHGESTWNGAGRVQGWGDPRRTRTRGRLAITVLNDTAH